jgi:protein involved in polysaccharide export with SLBB domain
MKKIRFFLPTVFVALLTLGINYGFCQDFGSMRQNAGSATPTSVSLPVAVPQENQLNTIVQIDVVDPSTYLLQPGDVVSFQFEGNFSLYVPSIQINPSGAIVIPNLGAFLLSDKTITEATEILSTFAKSKLKKTELTYFGLEKARIITVDVFGAAQQSGSYSLPGLSRLDALIAKLYGKAENISENDKLQSVVNKLPSFTFKEITDNSISYRDIIIKRKNGQRDTIDFVYFLRPGKKEANPVIQNGDQLFFTTQSKKQPRVSISGEVNAEGEFHFKKGESIQDILQLGSGFTTNSDTTFVWLASADGNKKVDRTQWSSVYLKPNERVVVPEKLREYEYSSAWVYGEVLNPGNYTVTDQETTVEELLQKAGGLTVNALPNGAYIIRSRQNTSATISAQSNFDLLLQRSSDQYIQGLEYLELESKLGRNRINLDLNDQASLKGIKIYDGDNLIIPQNLNVVTVFGQVMIPGQYAFDAKRSVEDYINKQAGGVTNAADANRIFIIKAGTLSWYKPEDTKLESGDLIFVDRVPYANFDTKTQIDISRNNLKLSIWSLVISAIGTTTILISALLR